MYPFENVHESTSLMSSSLLLQQSYLDDLWEGRYVAKHMMFFGLLLSVFFLNNTQVMLPDNISDSTTVRKYSRFILANRSDCYIVLNLIIAVYVLPFNRWDFTTEVYTF